MGDDFQPPQSQDSQAGGSQGGTLMEGRGDRQCWQGRRWQKMFAVVCPRGQWQEKRSTTRVQERGCGRSH